MDFEAILTALARAKVDFVVVGGVCAVLRGVPSTTFDLDIVPERSPENRKRLIGVLRALDARLREHASKRLEPKEEDLGTSGHILLATTHGPLDILGTVAGGRDYVDLVEHASEMDLGGGLRVRVLSLKVLIELKEATGREKDRAQLPLLRRTLELTDED